MKKIVLTSLAALSFVGAANSADLKVYASKDFDLTSGAFMAANLLQNIGFGVKYGQIRGEVAPVLLYSSSETVSTTTATRFGLNATGYYDLNKVGAVTPFVGAGVKYITRNTTTENAAGTTIVDTSINEYGVSGIGGLSVSATEHLNMDIYLVASYAGEVTKNNLTGTKSDGDGFSAAIGAKIRYTF